MATDVLDIEFPVLGVDARTATQSQPPYTCTFARNIWPRDPFAGRMRGGSRPGLSRVFAPSGNAPCWLVANCRVAEETGLTTFVEEFDRPLPYYWITAPWIGESVGLTDYPATNPFHYAYVSDNPQMIPVRGGHVLTALDIDPSGSYSVAVRVVENRLITPGFPLYPFTPMGSWSGRISLYARLSSSSPNPSNAGVEARLERASGDVPSAVFQLLINGTVAASANLSGSTLPVAPFQFSLRILPTNDAEVMIDNVNIIPATPIGSSSDLLTGFALDPLSLTYSPFIGLRCIEYFSVVHERTFTQHNRNVVVTVTGRSASSTHPGQMDLRYEDHPGVLVAPGSSSGANNDNDRQLQAVELFGRLYIVGDDDMEILQFSPIGAGTLTPLSSSTDPQYPYVAGVVPDNASAIAAWRSRLCVVERDDPQNISMSRAGIPGDWNYASLPVGSAVRLNTTGIDSGRVGEPINGLIPHSDDYLLIGCRNSLYVLRGDPTYGGQIDLLSSCIGMIGPQAWARGPNGETVFLSTDGVYGLAAGAMNYPESISRERLPNELRDIDSSSSIVMMVYDVRNRGFFIGVTGRTSGSKSVYYWMDWEYKGFWPMQFDSSSEPFSAIYRNADAAMDQRILFGCRDGLIRTLDQNAVRDDGLTYESELLIGPISLGGGGYFDGMILETIGQLGLGSGDVRCEIQVGTSVEDARRGKPRSAHTLVAGKNRTHRPRLRGNACFIRLVSSNAWAYENYTVVRERLGKQRL